MERKGGREQGMKRDGQIAEGKRQKVAELWPREGRNVVVRAMLLLWQPRIEYSLMEQTLFGM